MRVRTLALESTVLALLILTGCGKGSDIEQSQGQSSSALAAARVPSVKLSQSQLDSIKVGRAQAYAFPIERDAIGSVGFSDDPAVVQAESTLLAAAATYNSTQKELSRVQSLGQTNGIAQKEVDQAASDAQTATAALRAAKDAVRALGKSDAQINKMVSSGRIESPPSERRGAHWVVANAVESDSPLLRVGEPTEVSVMAIPDRTFKGVIAEIYSIVDPNTHRTSLRTEVSDPQNELRPGMLVNVAIQVHRPESSVGVPENAVVRKGDGTMTVWVTTDRINFFERTVQTGLREEGRVQVLQGLRENELVVTDGAIFLDNLLEAPPSD